MKNRFHQTIAAAALLAIGFVLAVPGRAVDADKITSYVEIARSVFGGDKTSADVVSATLAAAADKGVDALPTVGELSAALSAAEVAKDDSVADALAGIVNAVADAAGDKGVDLASRAAAAVAAVTGVDIADAIVDPALADAALDPDSVLSGADKADLKGLYDKVLAALKGAGYKAKEDGDKVEIDADSATDGDDAGEAAGADGDAGSDADAGSDDTAGGSDGKSGGSEGGKSGGFDDGDDNLGDPLDQTLDPAVQDPTGDTTKAPYGPHEYHPTPTTISGLDALVPVVTPATKPSKPKHTKPSPTPVGLR